MALPANTTFEVRTATGSDANGGGFIPGSGGTDYSQQTSAQFSGTNGVVSGTSFTSVSHSFVSTDVGNLINLSAGSGVTTGLYWIMSVTAGTATLDRSAGTGTGATWAEGGALASLTFAVANATRNNLIWCKGSQALTSTLTLSLSNDAGSAVNFAGFTFIGYSSTRGDGGRFTLTTATNSVDLITYSGGQYQFENFLMSCTAGTPGYGIIAGTVAWYFDLCLFNCRITGFEENIRSPYSTQIAILPITLIDCEIDSAVSHGIETVAQIDLIGCYIHGNGGNGLYLTIASGQVGTGFTATGCVFASNGGDGINHNTVQNNQYSTCKGLIQNCAFYSNTSGGYHFVGNQAVSLNLINNIFVLNGTALSGGSGESIVGKQLNNAFYGNTTLRANFPTSTSDITLTGDPFNNPSSGDFTLNGTTGAGAACKAAGFQSTLI